MVQSARTALFVGLFLGAALGAGGGWLAWGRAHAELRARITQLETAESAVQGERERLHRELSDIVRGHPDSAASLLRTWIGSAQT